jgi:hypothetical protein
MDLFSDIQQRKAANAKKLTAFGVASKVTDTGSTKLIRSGKNVTLYTVGYERRDGDGLISVLLDQGVKAIVDIRERPSNYSIGSCDSFRSSIAIRTLNGKQDLRRSTEGI